MAKEYKLIVSNREAKPRSKRLRELGVSGAVGGSTVVNVEGGGTDIPVGDGHTHTHTHANKNALDQITTDTKGYGYLTQLHEVKETDPDTGEERTEWRNITEKIKAGYADLAYDLSEDSPAARRFLSRIVDDMAEGKITFAQGLIALAISTFGELAVFQDGANFGEFIKGLYAGKGANIDKDGNAEFESVRVRSYFEAVEFIVNRLAAIEGDQLLTEGDTIERVEDLGDNCYGLYLRSKWDGYFTAQYPGNVIKGIINTLATGSGTYYTSWMRVNSVNPTTNYIEVTLYPDYEVPAGKNYPPCNMMKIARWGNQTDKQRQSCLYLSSTEGRIVHLTGVTKPIIDKENYGATFGTAPEFLKTMGLPLIDGMDYVYARGLVVQDIIRVDVKGKPIVTYVDRGEWMEGLNYYCEAINPTTGVYETSDVWYYGCKYRCCKNLTQTAPAWNNTDWAMVEGNPDFTIEFNDTDVLFDPDRFDLTLRIIAKLHNIVITDDLLDADIAWTRYSEDDKGVERVASDTAWALRRGGSGKEIHLTAEDIDFNGYVPKTVRFTATATLRDSMGRETAQDTAIFEL